MGGDSEETKKSSCLKEVAVIGGLFLVLVGSPFFSFAYNEFEGRRGNAEMKTWTKADFREVYFFAKSQCSEVSERKRVPVEELPLPMQFAGFEGATVEYEMFSARRGGSSFGSSGAYIRCWFGEGGNYIISSVGEYFEAQFLEDESLRTR